VRTCKKTVAERLRHDPAMRWIVGAAPGRAASPSQMGRFGADQIRDPIACQPSRIGYLLKRPIG